MGYLTGNYKSLDDASGVRGTFDRFKADAIEKNQVLVEKIREIAEKYSATPAQIALEWIRQQSQKNSNYPVIIPIPGTKNEKRAVENTKRISVSEEDLSSIDEFLKTFNVTGLRYNEDHQGLLYQ